MIFVDLFHDKLNRFNFFVSVQVRRLLGPNSGSFCKPLKFGSDGFNTWESKLGMGWCLCPT